jgi:hypothetical protein
VGGDGNAGEVSAGLSSRVKLRNAIAGRGERSVTTNFTPSQRQPWPTQVLISSSSVSSVTVDSSTIL